MATLRDLSRHLHLSITQVSRALNGHSDVSRETRDRVARAARELGYSPNLTARKLRSGRSGIVAMVVPARSEQVEIELLMESVMGLSAEFSRRGMQFVLHVLAAGEDPAQAHERLVRGGSIDGVVITDPRLDDPRIDVLERRGIPFIVHGRDRDRAGYPYVDIDHEGLAGRLARHLIGCGCRRLALIDGPLDRPYAVRRRAGVLAALAERDLEPALIRPGAMTEARGRAEAGRVIAAGADAAIAGNMMLAVGLRAGAPDLLLVAHDDGLLRYGAERFAPPIARSVAPLAEAWIPLSDGLRAAIEGQGDPVQLILETRFEAPAAQSA